MEFNAMKTLLFSAAAIALAGISPALAQTAVVDDHAMALQPVTRAQMVQKMQDHFAKLDTNRDGFVTKAEMDAAPKMRRFKMKDGHADGDMKMPDRGAMFDRLDANHDGSISRDEFQSARSEMRQRRVMVMNGDAKDMGSGRAGMRMHRLGLGMRGHMFEMADADKDGRVSIQEATNAAAAHFDKADANHDGTLTPDEMRAGHRIVQIRTEAD